MRIFNVRIWDITIHEIFYGVFVYGGGEGSMVMYLCVNQSISEARACGGGWRKFTGCGRLLWEN
jgi:hypothetical protein